MVRRALTRLADFQGWFGAAGLAMIASLVVIAVIFRYWIQAPLAWAEELSKLTLMIVVYFGTGAVAFHGQMLRADIFGEFLPKKWLHYREIALEATMAFMFGLLAVQVFIFANNIRAFGQVTAALEIPQWTIVGLFSIGIALLTIMHVYRLYALVRGYDLPKPPSDDKPIVDDAFIDDAALDEVGPAEAQLGPVPR